jgi:putative salt-induced outer membrane protein YdiY
MRALTHLTPVLVVSLAVAALAPASLCAQEPPVAWPGEPLPLPSPPPPPPPREPRWSGSFGFGLAITSGNADTSTLNVSLDLSTRPQARNVFKAEGLYLRGDRNGEPNVDRLSMRARNEYTRPPRAYVFGQVEYLRDAFKDIDYLVAPSIGLGYKVRDTPATLLAFDVGVGLKVERDTGQGVRTEGAVTAAQRARRQLSPHATITQSIAALWTVDRFDDALYTVKLGLVADLTRRSQVRIEVVDLYKTRPPLTTIGKNDVSVVTSLVYKF